MTGSTNDRFGGPRTGATAGGATPGWARPPATDALRARYARYRLQQGRELLTLLPREGVRALLRRLPRQEPGPDFALPMDELARACADLLPLPPFDVWLEDFNRNRAAHLDADLVGPTGPQAPDGAAVTLAVRSFVHEGEGWIAALVVEYVSPDWCGALHFHRGEGAPLARTGLVFRADRPEEVRERLAAFDDATLGAFLRSALP